MKRSLPLTANLRRFADRSSGSTATWPLTLRLLSIIEGCNKVATKAVVFEPRSDNVLSGLCETVMRETIGRWADDALAA